MGHVLNPYSWPALFSCAVLSAAMLLAWRRHPARGARALAALLLLALIWAAGQVAEINATQLTDKFHALKIEFIGVVLVAPMAVTFALQYAGYQLTAGRLSVIWLPQVLTLSAALVNPLSGGLMWRSVGLGSDGPFIALMTESGPLYWWLMVSSKVLAVTGALIVAWALVQAPRLYRQQSALILLGICFPALVNLSFVFGFGPVPNLDLTPLTLGISGLIYIVALYRYQMLDLVPIVRSTLIEAMQDGVLVVDSHGRCVDINPAARRLLTARGDVAGVHYAELIPHTVPHRQPILTPAAPRHQFWSGPQLIEVEPQQIQAHGSLAAWLLLLRDVTARHQLEQENIRLLTESNRRAAESEMLRAAGATIAASLSQQETIERIFAALRQIMPYDSASVLLLRDGVFEIVGGSGFSAPERVIGLRFPTDEDTPASRVYHTGQPYLLADARTAHPIFHKPPHNVIRSWLGVPLLVQDRVIGMVTLDSRKLYNFTDDDTRLVRAFADQIAIALDHARLFEDVQRLAAIDPLTETFNRRHFFDLGRRELDRARRYGHDVAALMLDIDHFKRVNDTYGHQAGDRVIQVVSHVAHTSLRGTDILARYGGEEFIILLPETDLNGALLLAERLRREIEALQIVVDGCTITITASLGVAVLLALHPPVEDVGESLEALVDRADQELYIAKQCGRNRVCAPPQTAASIQR